MTKKTPIFDKPAIDALLDIVQDGIWFWHSDSGYVYRSPGWYKMLGYDTDSLENTVFTWESIISPDDYSRVMEHFEAYINGQSEKYEIEYRCRTKSDEFVWIRDSARIVEKSPDGIVLRMIGAHFNIEAEKRLSNLMAIEKGNLQAIIDSRTVELTRVNKALKEKIKEAEHNATTDYLTGLSNRFHFENKLANEIARAIRFKEPLSLMTMDLDNFKTINDTYGHPKGDEVLVAVSCILKQDLRQIDIASRWGGDEFAILLPNTGLEFAQSVAEKIKYSINSELDNLKLNSSASFGVVEFSVDETQIDFIRRADMALYESKNTGGNKISIRH